LFSGVGFVSSQFKNGYEGFYDYYFPTDIGVIGMVHIYGLVYVVMFLLVVLYYYFQVKMRSDNYLHHALGLYFMYLLIISIQNGVGFMFSGAFMILIYFKSLLRGNDG
jgi:cbb3-type cytochrome oxidase subunit 3